METNFKRNSKKRARETKARSHVAGASKRKREKEPKMKLSNYEKAVRKFNLNQQLCMQGKTENRRITKGPLKIKSSRDGLFLKARRSTAVRKKPLNEANEARKNEDINRIIDIGSEMMEECSAVGKRRENIDILKRLNFIESSSTATEDEDEDDLLCCGNLGVKRRGGEGDKNKRRRTSPMEMRSEIVISSDSSIESRRSKRRRHTRKDTSAPGKLEDYLLDQFARSSSSSMDRRDVTSQCRIFGKWMKSNEAVPSSSGLHLKTWKEGEQEGHATNLDDFEKFTLRFENAVASVECPLLTGPGISESALSSLRILHRKRQELYEGSKMKKEVQEGVEFKSKKMYDPVLTWVLRGDSSGESEESPGASCPVPWNANFNSNIFTFRERPGKSGSVTALHRAHDPGQDMGVIDGGKVLSPRIRSPTPEYTRRDMF